MALSSGQDGTTTSRILNQLQYAVSNVAAANGTVAGNDVVVTLDASNNYEPRYSTVDQLVLSDGSVALTDLAVSSTATVTSASATALAVGLAGATNPAFVIDSSTASQAAGLKVTGATAAGTVAAAVISSGSDANLTINAKGTGTIGIGSVSTGAVTITPATTVAGALKPTGGLYNTSGAVATFAQYVVHTGGEAARASTDGTDATPSTTETYLAVIYVPVSMTVTGVSIFNGSATGSGNITVYIGTTAGAQVTGALSASTAISGTDAYQRVPFSAPITLPGPASYFVLSQYNNTSSRFNTHVFGDFPAGKLTSTTYGTFPAAFSAPTTFTTGLGPIASLY
jgi:hypothetical protein